MKKLSHQSNFHLEHQKLIFSSPVGSKLIGVETSKSDEDYLSVYSHKVIQNPFFVFPMDNEVVSVNHDNNTLQETVSMTATHVASCVLNPNSLDANLISTFLSLLAAVKFKYTTIHDEAKFENLKSLLCVPGNGKRFWQYTSQHHYNLWECMPTREHNWSQQFDGSDQWHCNSKKQWGELVYNYYPVVSQKVGYDVKFVSWILKDLVLIKNIILNNTIINEEDRKMIQDVKAQTVDLEELQSYKTKLWSQVRKAAETPMSTYLLGEGMSLEEAKNKNLFGLQGFLNTVNSFEETQ